MKTEYWLRVQTPRPLTRRAVERIVSAAVAVAPEGVEVSRPAGYVRVPLDPCPLDLWGSIKWAIGRWRYLRRLEA